MAADIHVANRLGDFWHVTRNTVAASAAGLVMSMFLERGSEGAGWGIGAVAIQAQGVSWFPQIRRILGPMHVVAREAGYAMGVHETGDEIVSLHAVLVGRSVRKMCECRFSKLVILKLPIIAQLFRDIVADRPIVILPIDGTGQRTAL